MYSGICRESTIIVQERVRAIRCWLLMLQTNENANKIINEHNLHFLIPQTHSLSEMKMPQLTGKKCGTQGEEKYSNEKKVCLLLILIESVLLL